MSEIIMISKFGKKVLQPFTVNKAEAIAEEENIINSTEGQDGANQDSEATSNLTD